jgi:hypothetical protein
MSAVSHALIASGEVARPQAVREGEVMWHHVPASAAARWVTCQSQAELLSGYGVPFTRMRYEDFAHQPRHTIELALTAIGLPPLLRYGRRPLERSSPRPSDE